MSVPLVKVDRVGTGLGLCHVVQVCLSSEDAEVQYIFCHVESEFIFLVRGSPTRKPKKL